jgi:hypothetical protein
MSEQHYELVAKALADLKHDSSVQRDPALRGAAEHRCCGGLFMDPKHAVCIDKTA